ncbi:MAG: hypothetical protein ACLSHJ_11975 [Oscillospiraceae bacterium]
MDHKKDQEFEQTLAESELLLRGAARSASDDADLTLESILAEFGSREDGAEAAAEPEDVGLPEPRPAVRIGKPPRPPRSRRSRSRPRRRRSSRLRRPRRTP